MFDIAFCDDSENDVHLSQGVIRLNGLSERFECPLDYWDKTAYFSQWYQGILWSIDEQLDSCLITSITDPLTANFLLWWPMYVEGSEVVFQNQVYFFGENEAIFDVENPYRSISPRRSVSEEGRKISEWTVAVSDLRKWIDVQRMGDEKNIYQAR